MATNAFCTHSMELLSFLQPKDCYICTQALLDRSHITQKVPPVRCDTPKRSSSQIKKKLLTVTGEEGVHRHDLLINKKFLHTGNNSHSTQSHITGNHVGKSNIFVLPANKRLAGHIVRGLNTQEQCRQYTPLPRSQSWRFAGKSGKSDYFSVTSFDTSRSSLMLLEARRKEKQELRHIQRQMNTARR